MPALTLLEIATQKAIKHVKLIDDLGEMQWPLAKPIIKAVNTATHLKELQDASPHLAQHTGFRWKQLILRDFPSEWARNPINPRNLASWDKVYAKVERMHKLRLEKDKAALIAARMEAAADAVESRPVLLPMALPAPDGNEAKRLKNMKAYGIQVGPRKPKSSIMSAVLKDSKAMPRRFAARPAAASGSKIDYMNLNVKMSSRPFEQQTHFSKSKNTKEVTREAAQFVGKYIADHKAEIETSRANEKKAAGDRVLARVSTSPSSSGSERSRTGIRMSVSRSVSATPSHASSQGAPARAEQPKEMPPPPSPATPITPVMAPFAGPRRSSVITVIGKDGKRKLERAPASAFAPVKRPRHQ